MKNLKVLPLFLALSLFFISCDKDDDSNSGPDGTVVSIENFYTPELLETLDELGFTINTGTTPPNIEGSYLANPLTLVSSNIPNDNIGTTYSDLLMTFTNQNNTSLTLDYEGMNNGSSRESIQSYVTGSDDSFSIFLKIEYTEQGHTSLFANAFSGILSAEGILDYQYALIMLDDRGDPNGNLIENNSGRLIVDGNGLCDIVLPRNFRATSKSVNNLPSPSKSL